MAPDAGGLSGLSEEERRHIEEVMMRAAAMEGAAGQGLGMEPAPGMGMGTGAIQPLKPPTTSGSPAPSAPQPKPSQPPQVQQHESKPQQSPKVAAVPNAAKEGPPAGGLIPEATPADKCVLCKRLQSGRARKLSTCDYCARLVCRRCAIPSLDAEVSNNIVRTANG